MKTLLAVLAFVILASGCGKSGPSVQDQQLALQRQQLALQLKAAKDSCSAIRERENAASKEMWANPQTLSMMGDKAVKFYAQELRFSMKHYIKCMKEVDPTWVAPDDMVKYANEVLP